MDKTSVSAAIKALGAGPLTLSDGRMAVVKDPTGEEVIKGAAAAGDVTNPVVLMMAVAWAATTVDGKPITWEEFKAMPLADIVQFVGRIGGNALSPALATFS
jgi:hypothetical protein